MIEVRIAHLSFSVPNEHRAAAFAALQRAYDEYNEYDDGSDSALLRRIDVLPHRLDGAGLVLGSNYDYVEQDEITQLLGTLAPFAVEGSRVVFCSRDVDEDWGYRVAGGELCEEIRQTVLVVNGSPAAAAQSYRDAAAKLSDQAAELVGDGEEMDREFTVVGAWSDDEPMAFGAIEGGHEVAGDIEYHGYQPWATVVEAADHDAALTLAVAKMKDSKAGVVVITRRATYVATVEVSRTELFAAVPSVNSSMDDAAIVEHLKGLADGGRLAPFGTYIEQKLIDGESLGDDVEYEADEA